MINNFCFLIIYNSLPLIIQLNTNDFQFYLSNFFNFLYFRKNLIILSINHFLYTNMFVVFINLCMLYKKIINEM